MFVRSCEQQTQSTPCCKTRKRLRILQVASCCCSEGAPRHRPGAVQAGWAHLPGSPERSSGELGRRVGDGQCCVSHGFAATLPGVSSVLPPPWVLEAPVSAGWRWLSARPLCSLQVEGPWGRGRCWRSAGQRGRADRLSGPPSSALCISSCLCPR